MKASHGIRYYVPELFPVNTYYKENSLIATKDGLCYEFFCVHAVVVILNKHN